MWGQLDPTWNRFWNQRDVAIDGLTGDAPLGRREGFGPYGAPSEGSLSVRTTGRSGCAADEFSTVVSSKPT